MEEIENGVVKISLVAEAGFEACKGLDIVTLITGG